MTTKSQTSTASGGDALIAHLDTRIAQTLETIQATELWQTVISPKTNPKFLQAIMRELYLEITSYQPHVIEAAIAAIGQMPRSMPVRMVKAMLRHQAEEFDHGEMAMRDYIAVGGDESYARKVHRISPQSFSVAAVWWMIARQRDPFAYLGALYPFEGLTPIVSELAKQALRKNGFPESALEFVEFHSTEDPKHTLLIKALIKETATRYPEAEASIKEGLEYFLAIYPLPVWQTAFERAKRNYRE